MFGPLIWNRGPIEDLAVKRLSAAVLLPDPQYKDRAAQSELSIRRFGGFLDEDVPVGAAPAFTKLSPR